LNIEKKIPKFKTQLENTLQELIAAEKTGSESARIVELDQSSVGRLSRMDAMQLRAVSIESNRRRKQRIIRIKEALKRIETGEYGYCLVCEEEIGLKRLEFDPSVTVCISCAACK